MARMRGGTKEKGRSLRARLPLRRAGLVAAARSASSRAARGSDRPSALILRMTSARKSGRERDVAIGAGLRQIIERAERQRLEADLGVALVRVETISTCTPGLAPAAAAAAPRARPSPASRYRAERCRERSRPRRRPRACHWRGGRRPRCPGSSSIQRETRPRTTAEIVDDHHLDGFVGAHGAAG